MASGDPAIPFLERAKHIAGPLYPHQVEGVAFLMGRRRALLADDMGLGKTRQSVVALTEAEPKGPYLVVCPGFSFRGNCQHTRSLKEALVGGHALPEGMTLHRPGSPADG